MILHLIGKRKVILEFSDDEQTAQKNLMNCMSNFY